MSRIDPPDLEQLRAWVEEWRENDPYEIEATRAARFLLSLVDGGGRLIVETPCTEHKLMLPHGVGLDGFCGGGWWARLWPKEAGVMGDSLSDRDNTDYATSKESQQ